jgi:hypothetical protein
MKPLKGVVTVSEKISGHAQLSWRALSSGTGHGSERKGLARVAIVQLIIIARLKQ